MIKLVLAALVYICSVVAAELWSMIYGLRMAEELKIERLIVEALREIVFLG